MNPQERDDYLNELRPEDSRPANITTFQAMKCAAILSAYQDGHEGWSDAVDDVSRFLEAAAAEGGGAVINPSSAQIWERIAELPFPPVGPPKPQPDVGQ